MPRNHYREPYVKTCDECNQIPEDKILWKEKVEHRLWCVKCWDYHYNLEGIKDEKY